MVIVIFILEEEDCHRWEEFLSLVFHTFVGLFFSLSFLSGSRHWCVLCSCVAKREV